MPDMELLKRRQTQIFTVRSVLPIALGSIGGAVATFGLFIPFLISCGIALAGLAVALLYLREIKHLRELAELAELAPDPEAKQPAEPDVESADKPAKARPLARRPSLRHASGHPSPLFFGPFAAPDCRNRSACRSGLRPRPSQQTRGGRRTLCGPTRPCC